MQVVQNQKPKKVKTDPEVIRELVMRLYDAGPECIEDIKNMFSVYCEAKKLRANNKFGDMAHRVGEMMIVLGQIQVEVQKGGFRYAN